MSDDKGFRKMNELVDALHNAESGLRKGALGITDLDSACNDARELYERLVVLRHKARENRQPREQVDKQAKAQEPVHEQVRPVAAAPPPIAAPVPPKPSAPVIAVPLAEVPAMKLDTRPQEIRQTSLIEAIADTEKEEAPVMKTASEFLKEAMAAKAAAGKTTPTVAEKLEKSHINDLGKAITVSDKFWFAKELFNDDRGALDRTIAELNSAKDLEEAMTLLELSILPNPKKPADPDARATFMELLNRRFA